MPIGNNLQENVELSPRTMDRDYFKSVEKLISVLEMQFFSVAIFFVFDHYRLPKSYQSIRSGYFSMPNQLSKTRQQERFRSAVNIDTLMGPASTHQTVAFKRHLYGLELNFLTLFPSSLDALY